MGSMIEGSSFSGLLTRVEIGHMRINSARQYWSKPRGSGSSPKRSRNDRGSGSGRKRRRGCTECYDHGYTTADEVSCQLSQSVWRLSPAVLDRNILTLDIACVF